MSKIEFANLDYVVMEHFFASVKELGRLADESIYQADVAARLKTAGIQVQKEVPVTATFKSFSKTYYLDLVVEQKAVYELKTVAQMTPEHHAQLMNYLFMVDVRRGKLVNLRPSSVESHFQNAPRSLSERTRFTVVSRDWKGSDSTKQWIQELFEDWGTGLALPLYHQAIVHFLGGEVNVTRQLPLSRDGFNLGHQRFHLMEEDAAFRLTAFKDDDEGYRLQLTRLLRHSPLKAIHWINMANGRITFSTVQA